jgi:hypothetical protein
MHFERNDGGGGCHFELLADTFRIRQATPTFLCLHNLSPEHLLTRGMGGERGAEPLSSAGGAAPPA